MTTEPLSQWEQVCSHPDALLIPAQAYLERLRVERKASEHTLSNYQRDLARLIQFSRQLPVARWDQLAGAHMQRFIAAEHRRGLSATSVQRLLSVCRGLFNDLLREGLLTANPTAGLRAPKVQRKLPEVLDVDEMSQLLSIEASDPLALRDRAILELFYSSGLRLAELCQLRWNDLQLDEGLVRVHGKGGKVRDVPVGRQARGALRAWQSAQNAPPDGPVFTGRHGKPISRNTVAQRLKHVAQQQGVAKRVHPHLLRHSVASHLLESSGDLRGVQEFLGHADIATTQIYTHLDFQHLARVHDAAHPRARRKR